MLRSHHLCCMAIHIEKPVTSEIREGVSRGYGGDANYSMGPSSWIQMPCCVWHWKPLRWWMAGVNVIYVAGWCPLGGLGRVCGGVLRPRVGPRVGIFL